VAEREQQPLEIRSFEIDARNSGHFQVHGVDTNLIYDVLAGEPIFFGNPPADNRSGTHLMIGPASDGRFWTIVIVMTHEPGVWRPITGWPSTTKEMTTWREETFPRPRNET